MKSGTSEIKLRTFPDDRIVFTRNVCAHVFQRHLQEWNTVSFYYTNTLLTNSK